MCTPPWKPLSNLPLPLPPASTWAFITSLFRPFGTKCQDQSHNWGIENLPNVFATSYASCGDLAGILFGVGIPYCQRWLTQNGICKHRNWRRTSFNSFIDWYSCIDKQRLWPADLNYLTVSTGRTQLIHWHTRAKEPAFLNDASI